MRRPLDGEARLQHMWIDRHASGHFRVPFRRARIGLEPFRQCVCGECCLPVWACCTEYMYMSPNGCKFVVPYACDPTSISSGSQLS
jgi:hypothetical protein